MKTNNNNSILDHSTAIPPIKDKILFEYSELDFIPILNKKIDGLIYEELHDYFKDEINSDEIQYIKDAIREFTLNLKK